MSGDLFRQLFDDASLFPPAALAMSGAVKGHLRHQAAWYRDMSGPFVCADTKIRELSAAVTAEGVAAVADHRYLAKVRTGGTTAGAFPDEPTLAACVAALAAERLPFKCTAGLHHAVRHTAPDTGFEHHGFLNVLLAVAAALATEPVEEITAQLADPAASRVAAKVSELDGDTVLAVRDLFTSFGTCSTDEPIQDLVTLGLIDA